MVIRCDILAMSNRSVLEGERGGKGVFVSLTPALSPGLSLWGGGGGGESIAAIF